MSDYLVNGFFVRWPSQEELVDLINQPMYVRVEDAEAGIVRNIPMPKVIGGVPYHNQYDVSSLCSGPFTASIEEAGQDTIRIIIKLVISENT